MAHPAAPLPVPEDQPDREGELIPGPWPQPEPEPEPEPALPPCALEEMPAAEPALCCGRTPRGHSIRIGVGKDDLRRASCAEIADFERRLGRPADVAAIIGPLGRPTRWPRWVRRGAAWVAEVAGRVPSHD